MRRENLARKSEGKRPAEKDRGKKKKNLARRSEGKKNCGERLS